MLIGIGLILFLNTFILKMRFDTLNRNLFVNDMTDHFFYSHSIYMLFLHGLASR